MPKHLSQLTVPFVRVVETTVASVAAVAVGYGSAAYGQVLPAQDGTGTRVDREGDRSLAIQHLAIHHKQQSNLNKTQTA